MVRINKQHILKNIGSYITVGLLPQITGFLMLPIYSRFMLPDDYGVLALCQSFNGMIIIFIGLQLSSALWVLFFDYEGEEQKTYFSTILWAKIFVAVVVVAILFIFGNFICDLLFSGGNVTFYPFLAIVISTAFLTNISSHTTRLLQVREQGPLVLKINVFLTATSVGFGVWFVVIQRLGARGALLAGLINGVIGMLIKLAVVREFIRVRFSWQMFVGSLKFSLPIIPHHLGTFLFVFSDRIILEKFVLIGAIGLYSIANQFGVLVKLVTKSINSALAPNFMKLSKVDKTQTVKIFKTIIVKWAVFISLVFLCLALFSEETVVLLLPQNYHGACPYIPILLFAYAINGFYVFSMNALSFSKKTIYIPLITGCAGVVNVALNLVFIPKYGVYAAAWTTVVSSVLTVILALAFSRWHYPLEYKWAKIFEIVILTAIAFFLVKYLQSDNMLVSLTQKATAVFAVATIFYFRNYGNVANDFRGLSRRFISCLSLKSEA